MHYKPLPDHYRLYIFKELSDLTTETGRIFLQNAMEAELNNRHMVDNRKWLIARLKYATDEARNKALAIFDEFAQK